MTNRTVPSRMHHSHDRRIIEPTAARTLARRAARARLVGHDHFGPTVDTVPVVWIGTRVYFYADGGSRSGCSVLDSSVVLEFDVEDVARSTDSTIVVHGTARAVTDVRREVLEKMLPRPHSDGAITHTLVEVSPTSISGVELTR